MKYLRRAFDCVLLPTQPFEEPAARWMDAAAVVTAALSALATVAAFWLSLPPQ